jgi:hypothetical protein
VQNVVVREGLGLSLERCVIVVAALDTACGYAALTLMPDDARC